MLGNLQVVICLIKNNVLMNCINMLLEGLREVMIFNKQKVSLKPPLLAMSSYLKAMRNISKGKGSSGDITDELDGFSGQTEVVNKFKQVYEELYNRSGSKDEMMEIETKMANLISKQISLNEILK